jgi:hypothetical protein
MKIRVNTKKLKSLYSWEYRLDNWLAHYSTFDGDIIECLALPNITTRDKVWITLNLMPRFLVEVFAMDCSTRVADYAADAIFTYASHDVVGYASDVSVAIAFSAVSAAAAENADVEEQRQLDALVYLIQTYSTKRR